MDSSNKIKKFYTDARVESGLTSGATEVILTANLNPFINRLNGNYVKIAVKNFVFIESQTTGATASTAVVSRTANLTFVGNPTNFVGNSYPINIHSFMVSYPTQVASITVYASYEHINNHSGMELVFSKQELLNNNNALKFSIKDFTVSSVVASATYQPRIVDLVLEVSEL